MCSKHIALENNLVTEFMVPYIRKNSTGLINKIRRAITPYFKCTNNKV